MGRKSKEVKGGVTRDVAQSLATAFFLPLFTIIYFPFEGKGTLNEVAGLFEYPVGTHFV